MVGTTAVMMVYSTVEQRAAVMADMKVEPKAACLAAYSESLMVVLLVCSKVAAKVENWAVSMAGPWV